MALSDGQWALINVACALVPIIGMTLICWRQKVLDDRYLRDLQKRMFGDPDE